MNQLIPLIVGLVLLLFWVWMFRDFTDNRTIPPQLRLYWLAAFLFLSILTAGYYYFTEYKKD